MSDTLNIRTDMSDKEKFYRLLDFVIADFIDLEKMGEPDDLLGFQRHEMIKEKLEKYKTLSHWYRGDYPHEEEND